MTIQWKDSFSIGVLSVDNQHKELIKRLSRLQEAAISECGMDELRNLMEFMEEYVVSHFRDEEALQILHEYPAFAAHRSEHAYFIEQLGRLKHQSVHDGITARLVSETATMLTTWLLDHICSIDMEFGAYLKSRNSSRDWLRG